MAVRIIVGENDLATTHPELVEQWDYSNNGELKPNGVTYGSKKRVWWLCAEGHSWAAAPSTRTRGRGCSVCSGNIVFPGVNDLQTTNPDLASEWHLSFNGDLRPTVVTAGSQRKVWWLCHRGHAFESRIYSRSGPIARGCAYCSGKRAIPGETDLATTHPEIAKQWHETRNGEILPTHVSYGSKRKFWWRCPKGHEYQANCYVRTQLGGGCQYCSGKAVLAGFNDLAAKRPELALEWDFERNAPLRPEHITTGTDKKFYWLCTEGHSQYVTPRSREPGGCGVCAGYVVIAGVNDLQTVEPELAREWDFEENYPLTPMEVSRGSNKKAFWICPIGHRYLATINDRVGKESGCPVCSGREILPGFNDLETLYPDLAREWEIEKNGGKEPRNVSPGTNTRYWWSCPEGHSYLAAPVERRRPGQPSGCPTCAKYGFDPGKPAVLYFISNEGLRARKIGITNLGTTRLKVFRRNGWKQIFVQEHHDGRHVSAVEATVLRWIREDLALPPFVGRAEMRQTMGWSETFSMAGPSDADIIARIESEFANLHPTGD